MSEDIENSEAGSDADWGAALAEQAASEAAASPEQSASASQEDYVKADFQNLEDESRGDSLADANLDMILDIPVTVAVEIGRSKVTINNLLKLNQGSVVELDRLAGEPMDVNVNGTLIAHGEVVVVNEKFGIRLTDIISPAERVKKLK
ncbi:MAG TPA: flagellar motor switch protein FliN [Chromatiales bacterium]|nr:flagellar motor switch protein FliN [Chromatiales bacterium]